MSDTILFRGFTASDPALSTLPNGVTVVNFRLASTPLWQDATGSWRQAFSMPPGGGELVVSHRSTAGTVAARIIWVAWAITVLAALPLRRRRTIA